jgi:uncharacterized protein YbaR (Trm112 family)
MKLTTLNKLCCPFDKADLSIQIIAQELQENILEGLLTCKVCNRYYPIIKGIPIMSPDEYREFKLEQPLIESWQSHLPGMKFKNYRLESAELVEDQKELR